MGLLNFMKKGWGFLKKQGKKLWNDHGHKAMPHLRALGKTAKDIAKGLGNSAMNEAFDGIGTFMRDRAANKGYSLDVDGFSDVGKQLRDKLQRGYDNMVYGAQQRPGQGGNTTNGGGGGGDMAQIERPEPQDMGGGGY